MNAEHDQDTGLIRPRPPRPNRAVPRRRRSASLNAATSRVDVDALANPLPDSPGVRIDRYFWSTARQELCSVTASGISEESARRIFINHVRRAALHTGGHHFGVLIICAFIFRVTYL